MCVGGWVSRSTQDLIGYECCRLDEERQQCGWTADSLPLLSRLLTHPYSSGSLWGRLRGNTKKYIYIHGKALARSLRIWSWLWLQWRGTEAELVFLLMRGFNECQVAETGQKCKIVPLCCKAYHKYIKSWKTIWTTFNYIEVCFNYRHEKPSHVDFDLWQGMRIVLCADRLNMVLIS